VFAGRFVGGKKEFVRTGPTFAGKPLLSRLTFSWISTIAVEWDLAVSLNQGNTWRALWQMAMQRGQAAASCCLSGRSAGTNQPPVGSCGIHYL
jgi:hypothetical protein